MFVLFFHGATVSSESGLLVIEDSRLYSDTRLSVGLLCLSGQSDRGRQRVRIPPEAGFEPAIPASKRLQTQAATAIG